MKSNSVCNYTHITRMITDRTELHSVHKERTTEVQICPDNFTPGEDTETPCTFLEMSRLSYCDQHLASPLNINTEAGKILMRKYVPIIVENTTAETMSTLVTTFCLTRVTGAFHSTIPELSKRG